jgi:hypothetical protein
LNYTFQDIPKTYCGVFAPCGMWWNSETSRNVTAQQ